MRACHWAALAGLTLAGVIAGHAATYRLLLGSSAAAVADVGHLHRPTLPTLAVVAALLLATCGLVAAAGVLPRGRGSGRGWRARLATAQVLTFTGIELGERFLLPGPASAELGHVLPLALLLPFGWAVQVVVATATTALLRACSDWAGGLPRRRARAVLGVAVARPVATLPARAPATAWGYGARGVRGPPPLRS